MSEISVRARWRHVNGHVVDCFGRTVPLADAKATFEEWQRLGEQARDEGNLRIAQTYIRDALALAMPASLACEFRKAAGWSDPFAMDQETA